MGPGTLVFNGATFTLSSSGAVTLQLSGLRAAANELDFDSSKSIQVVIGLNPNTSFPFQSINSWWDILRTASTLAPQAN